MIALLGKVCSWVKGVECEVAAWLAWVGFEFGWF